MRSTDPAELARDIQAFGSPVGTASHRWMTQPAIVRRVAAELARSIPATTDRILASGDHADLLGMAAALSSGLPVAILSTDGRMLGDRHAGESTFAIGLSDDGEDAGTFDLVVIGTQDESPCLFRTSARGLIPCIEQRESEEMR